jgi:hypothetical protein
MTSKKVHVLLVALLLAMAGGCDLFPQEERIEQPRMLPSPYPSQKLWAVVPFRNESGTTTADGIAMADHLTQQLQQVEAMQVLPVNRVIASMEAMHITQVTNLDQAMSLMHTLDVDGLLIGTITAWDPYDPPKIGVTVALYTTDRVRGSSLDTRQLSAAPTDNGGLAGERRFSQPISQVTHYFDAANGAVLQRLKTYATGRAPSDSPAGWRRYLLNMDLYSEFVTSEIMRRTFAAEWQRLTVEAGPPVKPGEAGRPAKRDEATLK